VVDAQKALAAKQASPTMYTSDDGSVLSVFRDGTTTATPGTDVVQVLFDSNQPEIIQLLNMQGSVLKSQLLISGEAINASDLASGCYYIRVGNRMPLQWIKVL
jgi:hypothetical protein